jgi:hypothetical protein
MKMRVTERSLIARVNRKLAGKRQRLHKTKGRYNRTSSGMGVYYIVDEHRKEIVDAQMDAKRLANVARELGALAEWEEIEGSPQ